MAQARILIIEDEKALADILEYNLVREGYQVFTANDGVEGLEKALEGFKATTFALGFAGSRRRGG